MKKIKLLNIIILVFICLFVFKIEVKAEEYNCIYENNGEIVTISIDSEKKLLSRFTDKYNTTQSFYPINFAQTWVELENGGHMVFFGSGGGYGTQGNYKVACPNSITNYYKQDDNPLTSYLTVDGSSYDVGSDVANTKIPIIYYSSYATTSDNEQVNLYLYNDKVVLSLLDIEKKYTNKKKYTLKTLNIQKPDETTDVSISCSYKNTATTGIYKFTFLKNKVEGHFFKYNNGQEHKLYLSLGSREFITCPSVIKLDEKQSYFSIVEASNCPFDNKLCYYRDDVSPYYSNDSATIYIYYEMHSSSDKITVQIPKNSEDVKILDNTNKEINMNVSSDVSNGFLSGNNIPIYLFKLRDGSYIFADSKKDEDGNDIIFDKMYISSSELGKIIGLGGEQIYKTCRQLFGDTFLTFLEENVFGVVRIGVIILLVLLTTYDFAKVVFVDDKEGMQNAFKNFKRRAIAAVLIFLTPTIIILIANLVGAGESVQECAKTIRSMSTEVVGE